jgi:hypothetical protein
MEVSHHMASHGLACLDTASPCGYRNVVEKETPSSIEICGLRHRVPEMLDQITGDGCSLHKWLRIAITVIRMTIFDPRLRLR